MFLNHLVSWQKKFRCLGWWLNCSGIAWKNLGINRNVLGSNRKTFVIGSMAIFN
jgi:hypothetical protein